MLDWYEWNSYTSKRYTENMTEEEYSAYCLKCVKSFLDREGNLKMHSKTGYIKHWLLEKDQKFDSSFEELYYKKLNDEKIYWKNNLTIYIPYIHPKDNKKHYYVPDVLIYKDKEFEILETIVEVKPSEFVENPNNKKGEYYEITKRKLEALKNFCDINNLNYKVITEKHLGDYSEDKKNHKKVAFQR